jgi:hypothetical protein
MWQPLDHRTGAAELLAAGCSIPLVADRAGNSLGSSGLVFLSDRNACPREALTGECSNVRKEDVMRKLLMAAAAAGTLVATVPASAQIYLGADPDGAGVQIGPFGFGVGPRYGWRGDDYYAYGADCPVVRERVVTPDGRVIYRTQRACR